MTGDRHVRFCEGVGVRFPRATQLSVLENLPSDEDMTEQCSGGIGPLSEDPQKKALLSDSIFFMEICRRREAQQIRFR